MLKSSVKLSGWCIGLILAGTLARGGAWAANQEITDPGGQVIRVIGPDGAVVAQQLPPEPAAPLASDGGSGEVVTRDDVDPATGTSVDANGVISGGGIAGRAASSAAALAAPAARITIDEMTTRSSYTVTYQVATGLDLLGGAEAYHLSDGTSWSSGAGSYTLSRGRFGSAAIVGNVIRYTLQPPTNGILYQQTDYDSGDHSAQGTLGVAGPLVLEAVLGSTTAVLRGQAELVANDPTWYGEPRFNYYSAVVGSVVPFEITYTLANGATWSATSFDFAFSVSYQGRVDFASPISVPQLVSLGIQGSGQLPPSTTAQYYAIAKYDNGVQKDVTSSAVWAIEPVAAASVDAGQVVTASACDGVILTLRAGYSEGGLSVQGEKPVSCIAGTPATDADNWETFQGDPRHSGYVPISLEPSVFSLRWQRNVGAGQPLNPVTSAGGKVFVSLDLRFNATTGLFVLDERDGATLWSKNFGNVNSVNPPAYGYGNVYIQTGNHSNDTFLWAFDAETGAQTFKSPHEAQWESYYAPTPFDGSVYVDGGYYGGMYSFSAFSGAQNWFLGLPQYDEWTPAVDAGYAYAYVGEYSPGVYAADRITGALKFMSPDPNFSWNGWSMRLAPVLGDMNDVVAIHGGRLIRFDLQNRSIAWQLKRSFSGQPAVAKGVIYAIDGPKLVAVDEATGATLWSWQPASGQLSGALIVTDTHVLAATGSEVHAVELLSHASVWSYPAAGQLALGGETLYVASSTGMLTAIATPAYTPASLTKLEILGPARVVESGTATFTARAYYDDGRIRDRTALCHWSVDPATYASIDTAGQLTVGELLVPSQRVVVRADYSEGSSAVQAELSVQLAIAVPIGDFVKRNLLASRSIKQKVLADLTAAEARELAAAAVLRPTGSWSLSTAMRKVRGAMLWGWLARSEVERSIDELDASLAAVDQAQPK